MAALTWSINKSIRGLSGMLVLFWIITKVHANTLPRGKRETEDRCPKWEFWLSSNAICVPCHLCDPDSQNLSIFLDVCKKKNPNMIPHHGNQVAWCDNPGLPSPECPPLPDTLLLNPSPECSKFNRKFAPGCECSMKCGERRTIGLRCTQDLKWNDTGAVENCKAIMTTTAGVPITTAPEQTITDKSVPSAESGLTVLIVATTVSLCVIVAIAVVVFVAIWVLKHRTFSGSNTTSRDSLDNASQSSNQESPASVKRGSQENSMERDESAEHLLSSESQPEKRPALNDECETPKAPPQGALLPSVPREHNNLQKTEADFHAMSELQFHIHPSFDVKSQSESELHRKSYAALGDFLKSRDHVMQFRKLLDQRFSYGETTWHTMARNLVHWDVDTVRSEEYLRDQTEGLIYKVMREAHQKGHGLLDILNCLQGREFRNRKAEDILQTFWKEWNEKYAGVV